MDGWRQAPAVGRHVADVVLRDHCGQAGVTRLAPRIPGNFVGADQRGVALRGGHHCNQPLMRKLGVESTARASFYFYNTTAEIDRLAEVLGEIQRFFGG